MMLLNHIQAFVKVAELSSFRGAADLPRACMMKIVRSMYKRRHALVRSSRKQMQADK